MARLTFRQILAEIQRYPGLGGTPIREITDAIETASKDVGNQPWPWNYAETNILVPAPYSTGTISVNNGSATVTGVLTVWDVSWYGRRIRFGNSNIDYVVSAINNPLQLILTQPVNLSASLVGSSYTMYQDTYLYPEDYIVGSDVGLFQPTVRTRIPKVPRYVFESAMNAGLRSVSTSIQTMYCDHGEDLTSVTGTNVRRLRFRLGPPPSGPAELRLCYHQMAPDMDMLTTHGNTVTLPEGFDEIITLYAASRLYDNAGRDKDAERTKAIATGKLKLLRRAVLTQTIDDIAAPSYGMSDSSISQWGMTIERMT